MAINPSAKLPEFIDNTWTNQSPGDRLLSIEQLQKQGQAAQQALLHIAQHDEHAEVRCGAARYLRDISALKSLQQADDTLAEVASQQCQRLLAGVADSDLDDAERLEHIHALPLEAAKQVALLTKLKSAGSAALNNIGADEELADLSLFAASVHVRKNAVLKIHDQKLLQEIYSKIKDKDKTLSKLLEQRLTENETSNPAVAATPAAKPKAARKTAEANKPMPEPATELPRIGQQLEKLSHKHTDALNALRSTLNRCRKAIPADAVELEALAQELHSQLTDKLKKNQQHQEHLQESTTTLLEQLQQALDAGQSHDALPAWDKIQGNISNTSGKIRTGLQKLAAVHKAKLNELRDWKAFAATEKKKELITQMQHLLESKMHAADRSKHISKMHQEWKALGRSNQNEQLWREFKKISDQAYKPCKEYFRQRKQLMASNYTRRREICEQLEAELARLEADAETAAEDELNISGLNKLLSDADKNWKDHAPIEQSKIKPLQKRYYAAVNKIRKIRKHCLRGNGSQKLEFIAQANALAESDDNQHAMREAKVLQKKWKNIGPTSFKEDKKYWEDFRAACDKIFARRNLEASAQRDKQNNAEGKLSELLSAMETIFKLEDDAFRSARGEFKDLAQQFSNSIDPRQRHQSKRLTEQFNGLKRKIDSRFRALPDKKTLLLKANITAKAEFLQTIENKLLASTSEESFKETLDSLDIAAWQAIGEIGEKHYDNILNKRLQALQKSTTPSAWQKLADENSAQVKALCVELEIRANADTPKEDQALRMQLQLEQLKQGFGRQKPSQKENLTFATDAELEITSLGPLDTAVRKHALTRLHSAARKL